METSKLKESLTYLKSRSLGFEEEFVKNNDASFALDLNINHGKYRQMKTRSVHKREGFKTLEEKLQEIAIKKAEIAAKKAGRSV